MSPDPNAETPPGVSPPEQQPESQPSATDQRLDALIGLLERQQAERQAASSSTPAQAQVGAPPSTARPQPAPMASHDPQTQTIATVGESTTGERYNAASTRAERIAALDIDACPNCTSGVLRVTVYDEVATHEFGQELDHMSFQPSGGAVQRHCFHCEYHESVPLNAIRAGAH